MKAREPHFGRNGLILSQAMTLCTKYDMYSRAAVLLSTLEVVSWMRQISWLRQHSFLPAKLGFLEENKEPMSKSKQ